MEENKDIDFYKIFTQYKTNKRYSPEEEKKIIKILLQSSKHLGCIETPEDIFILSNTLRDEQKRIEDTIKETQGKRVLYPLLSDIKRIGFINHLLTVKACKQLEKKDK